MDKQLDQTSGNLLQTVLENKGINFKLEANTTSFIGAQQVKKVEFADNSSLDADMVVMSVGIVPNDALAKASGLQTDKGIIVSDTMMSSDPAIYSVGECIKHRH